MVDSPVKIGNHIFVTGAAGFIGSNLVDRLLSEGYQVRGFDNFSTGREEFLTHAHRQSGFQLIRGDCLNLDELTHAMKDCDFVFHLSANADVRFGVEHPSKDLQQNTIATFHVLEAMRSNSIQKIAFASTGSIYGETKVIPTPETAPFPIQTSLYGASKLASEGLIQAYCEGFGMEGTIFRFVSILGERYSHGHIFDFYQQLRANPDTLKVLGDGKQKKSYLYVGDCIEAMLTALNPTRKTQGEHQNRKKIEIFNLGTPEYCQVVDSIGWICSDLGLKPQLEFTGGHRGWIGDNPFIFLDTQKIQQTGWKAKLSIQAGIIKTLHWLKGNVWIFR